MAAETNVENHRSEILNVLLHGAFTFVHDEKRKRIVAAIPQLERHAYRAGSWLAETELRGGASYDLKGVKADKALNFERGNKLLATFESELLSTKPVPYATLTFPYPKAIRCLRVAEVQREFFTHSEDLIGPGKTQQMPTLQVFTYDIDDENKLALQADLGEGHYWEPAFTKDHINLHIFSSEDYYHKPSNVAEDFNQCAALLGTKLRLKTEYLPTSLIPDDRTNLPYGVAAEETEALAARTLRMARLGRLVVQKGDANLAWCGNDALDGDPEACAPIAGCVKY